MEVKPQKRTSWNKVITSIISIILACFLGVWIGYEITPDSNTVAKSIPWTSLGTPPSNAVNILGESPCGTSYEVVVQTISGKNYLYCQTGWQQWTSSYANVASLFKCNGNPPTAYSPRFEELPNSVVDCSFQFTNEYNNSELVYTILNDGSVWKWNFSYGISTVLGYMFGGFLSGFLVGIAIAIWLWRKTV